jgi:predicted small secreted protein
MKRTLLVFAVVLTTGLFALHDALAADNVFKEFGEDASQLGKRIGKTGKEVGKDLGKAGKQIGKDFAKGAKDVGKAISGD